MEIFDVAEAMLYTMLRFIIWIPQHLGFLLPIAICYLLIRVWFKVIRFLFLGPAGPSTKLFIATAKPAGPPNGMSKEVWISKELTKLPEIIAKAELEAEHEWRIENGEHEGCPKCKPKEKFGVPARLREPEPVGITDRLMRAEWSEDGQSVTFERTPPHRHGKISLDMHGNRYCETCGALTPNWKGDWHDCIV